jgi:hypothetical protein
MLSINASQIYYCYYLLFKIDTIKIATHLDMCEILALSLHPRETTRITESFGRRSGRCSLETRLSLAGTLPLVR